MTTIRISEEEKNLKTVEIDEKWFYLKPFFYRKNPNKYLEIYYKDEIPKEIKNKWKKIKEQL